MSIDHRVARLVAELPADMLSCFYAISNLTDEGVPVDAWRRELEATLALTA